MCGTQEPTQISKIWFSVGPRFHANWAEMGPTPGFDNIFFFDQKQKIGTTRYLAPEILTCTFKRELFSSYHKCDVYSMALVFWEVLNRTRVSSKDVESFSEYR